MDEKGNDFHYKVADYFEAEGWSVERSPYYVDVIKQKSREIDIIAKKTWTVVDRFQAKRAYLIVRLFVECKWILPAVSVYLNFLPKDMNLAVNLARDNDALRKRDYPHLEDLSKEPPRIHHYVQGKEVARNWACKGKDIFYEAWEQALHALLYFKNQPSQHRFAPVDVDFRDKPTYIIDYPIVVVSSFKKFFKRDSAAQTSEVYPVVKTIFRTNYVSFKGLN